MGSESNYVLNIVLLILLFSLSHGGAHRSASSSSSLSSSSVQPDHTVASQRAQRPITAGHLHSIDHDSHHCNHQYPAPHEVNHVHLEPEHVLRKRDADSPLRIKIHYDDSVQDLPPEKFEVINNTILPQAISYWESALFVRPLNVPIKLTRRCYNNQAFYPENSNYRHQYCKNRCAKTTTCGEVVVPKEHLDACRICNSKGKNCTIERGTSSGTGIESADFVLYISALQTDRCNKTKSSTVAYAAHCQQESAMDRPIAGHINLCLDSISTKTQDLETLLSTIKHELLHTLAFSVSLYAYFRKPDGSPLIERNSNGRFRGNQPMSEHLFDERIIRKVVRSNWQVREGRIKKEVYMIVTPRVVEEVRKHFNCSTLEGAELEDQGSDGTLLTHWEKRVFENEAMTGTHTQNPIYSRITFALIEDTGWYMPNYNLAQPLKWGKNLGCDFVKKSCKDWIDSKRRKQESIHPFCEKVKKDPLETECTDDRSAVALCNLKRFNYELPSIYQNFDKIPDVNGSELGMYGGSVSLADYCPYKQEFTWKFNDVIIRGSQCQFPENSPAADKNFALEYYGEGSKCFNHNKKMWEERTCEHLRQWQHYGSGCYNYLCKDGRLHLSILNQTYTCYSRNQEIKIQRYANAWLHIGTIVCPPCKEICSSSGMKCKQEIVKPSPIFEKSYFKDTLKCCSLRQESFNILIGLMLVGLGVLNRLQVQWVT